MSPITLNVIPIQVIFFGLNSLSKIKFLIVYNNRISKAYYFNTLKFIFLHHMQVNKTDLWRLLSWFAKVYDIVQYIGIGAKSQTWSHVV